MPIANALASLAVRDLDAAVAWYEKLLDAPPARPMAEVAEWMFPRGGGLQVYQLAERAGACSCTLAVSDLDAEAARLQRRIGIDPAQVQANPRVRTLMLTDPDGNHIALAQAIDPQLAR